MANYILQNDKDNCITVLNEKGIKDGTLVEGLDVKTSEKAKYGEKISIIDMAPNNPIIRYGEIIGYTKNKVKKGGVIRADNVFIKKSDNLNVNIPFTSNNTRYNHKERYFYGYKNSDGTIGTRNFLAVSTNVQCSEGFIKILQNRITKELLPKYPNVDGVVTVSHAYGCGVAINADNSDIPQRIIKNILTNPNFGNQVLLVSLGCEKLTPDMLGIESSENIIIQQKNNLDKSLKEGLRKAESKLKILNKRQRTKQHISKLRVGVQCGGSDALSGITANPVIGYVSDRLSEYGASVVFSEVTEIRDAAHIILSRIRSEDLRKKFVQEMRWYDEYLEKSSVDRSANPAPGNKAGGLLTIIDKAMGSVAKSGSAEIVDVLRPGEKIKKEGLTFAATPASDFVCGTCQLASGINLMLFSTGRGTTYNLEYFPVIKISTNTNLYKKWNDLIDFDTGCIAFGVEDVQSCGEQLLDLIISSASGEYTTKADKYKLYNSLSVFNPAPIT